MFLYLKAFSSTGGIENYNKLFIKALSELYSNQNRSLKVLSLYDVEPDTRYITSDVFLNTSGNKIRFVTTSLLKAIKHDLVIISHLNLSILVLMIKLLNKNKKVYILTYGIDVWNKPSLLKKIAMRLADRVFTISNFTKTKIVETFNINENKITILPCALDPYFTEYSAKVTSKDPPRVYYQH